MVYAMAPLTTLILYRFRLNLPLTHTHALLVYTPCIWYYNITLHLHGRVYETQQDVAVFQSSWIHEVILQRCSIHDVPLGQHLLLPHYLVLGPREEDPQPTGSTSLLPTKPHVSATRSFVCSWYDIFYHIVENFQRIRLSRMSRNWAFCGENFCGMLNQPYRWVQHAQNFVGENFCGWLSNHEICESFLPQKL